MNAYKSEQTFISCTTHKPGIDTKTPQVAAVAQGLLLLMHCV